MKKTWNIGERCRYGTFRILKKTDTSVTVGLSNYKEKEIQEQETFTKHNSLFMWLGEQMDSYTADLILEDIKKSGTKLSQNSMW